MVSARFVEFGQVATRSGSRMTWADNVIDPPFLDSKLLNPWFVMSVHNRITGIQPDKIRY